MSQQPSAPEYVPASSLHAGDEILAPVDGHQVHCKIADVLHGSTGIRNFCLCGCVTDDGVRHPLGFLSESQVLRVSANKVAA